MKACARILVRDDLVYTRGPPPENAQGFTREITQYMVIHYYRYAVTMHKRHHWLNSVSLDGVDEDDIANFDVFAEGLPNLKHKEQYQVLSLVEKKRSTAFVGFRYF